MNLGAFTKRIGVGIVDNLNFVEKIRLCLCFYLTIDYAIEKIHPVARDVRPKQTKIKFKGDLQPDLFSMA